MSSNPYRLTSPCNQCPFRTDIKPFLKASRVEELSYALQHGEFPCHKTTKPDASGELQDTKDSAHCAGALILLEKIEQPSQMMRISERIGMYDHKKLNMAAPVFDCWEDMIEAQED